MSENMKLFLEKASADEALCKRVSEEKDVSVLIALAKEMGILLTAEDFKMPVEELSDDELDVVAGGGECVCALGGGGTKDSNDKACGCVIAGAGLSKEGRERCACPIGGYGYNS